RRRGAVVPAVERPDVLPLYGGPLEETSHQQGSQWRVNLGAPPPPAALDQGPTGRRNVKNPAAPEGHAVPHSSESLGIPGTVRGGEGDLLGNVNRGERT